MEGEESPGENLIAGLPGEFDKTISRKASALPNPQLQQGNPAASASRDKALYEAGGREQPQIPDAVLPLGTGRKQSNVTFQGAMSSFVATVDPLRPGPNPRGSLSTSPSAYSSASTHPAVAAASQADQNPGLNVPAATAGAAGGFIGEAPVPQVPSIRQMTMARSSLALTYSPVRKPSLTSSPLRKPSLSATTPPASPPVAAAPASAPAPADGRTQSEGEDRATAAAASSSIMSGLVRLGGSIRSSIAFIAAAATGGGGGGEDPPPNVARDEDDSPEAFLHSRRSAAAQLRQKLSGDPSSPASQAIVKRRLQVFTTVKKARFRLTQLSHETGRRKRQFRPGIFGRFQRWVFEREQRRLRGKGPNLLRLWVESLKLMENCYGSSIMLAFAFIRWVFLLNSVLAVMWIIAMIIPFLAFPPASFSWRSLMDDLTHWNTLKHIAQGDNLEKTFVYYGGYSYYRWEQQGWYRTDYMYPVMIGATFLISFLAALARIAGRIMNSGDIAMAARLYPFSTLVFASWDFHITSLEAATKLRRGIRMQLKEMVADTKDKTPKTGFIDHLMSAKRFVALFVLWPLLMGGTVFAVIQLVTQADRINNRLGSQYAQALLFSVLNNVTPVAARFLVEMEEFKPATAEKMILGKLFCLRTLNLATLIYRLFMMLRHTLAIRMGEVAVETCTEVTGCSEGFYCCTRPNLTQWHICTEQDIHLCLPACTENLVGVILLRLISITTVARVIFEFVWGFGYVWISAGNKRQLYIEDMAMDIVFVQALVWVGACFSPMAPVLGFFSNLVTWYTMRFALFRTCAPVEKAFSASRTSSLTYGLLLFTLILSSIPATITVMQKNSGFCGPIHGQTAMYDVVGAYIQKAPAAIWITLSWVANPAVLLGAIFFLIFMVVLVQSQLLQTRQFLALTKFEMGTQRKELDEKLKRLRQIENLEDDIVPLMDSHESTSDTGNSFSPSSSSNYCDYHRKLLQTVKEDLDHIHEDKVVATCTSETSPEQPTLGSNDVPLHSSNNTSNQVKLKEDINLTADLSGEDPSQAVNKGNLSSNAETQEWQSLGHLLRRLSQSPQGETTSATQVEDRSSTELALNSTQQDWHSLGEVLMTMTQRHSNEPPASGAGLNGQTSSLMAMDERDDSNCKSHDDRGFISSTSISALTNTQSETSNQLETKSLTQRLGLESLSDSIDTPPKLQQETEPLNITQLERPASVLQLIRGSMRNSTIDQLFTSSAPAKPRDASSDQVHGNSIQEDSDKDQSDPVLKVPRPSYNSAQPSSLQTESGRPSSLETESGKGPQLRRISTARNARKPSKSVLLTMLDAHDDPLVTSSSAESSVVFNTETSSYAPRPIKQVASSSREASSSFPQNFDILSLNPGEFPQAKSSISTIGSVISSKHMADPGDVFARSAKENEKSPGPFQFLHDHGSKLSILASIHSRTRILSTHIKKKLGKYTRRVRAFGDSMMVMQLRPMPKPKRKPKKKRGPSTHHPDSSAPTDGNVSIDMNVMHASLNEDEKPESSLLRKRKRKRKKRKFYAPRKRGDDPL